MSAFIIGDLHYKKTNKFITDIAEENILELIKEQNPSFVVILGDTFNDHNKLWLTCYMRVCKFFEKINNLGKHIFLIIGNHEREDNKVYMTDEHFFYGHKYNPMMTIIDRLFVYDFQLPDKILKICFMPYVPPNKVHQCFIDCNIDPLSINLFFSHIDINGSKTQKLARANWEEWPPNYALNISGHVHDEEIVSHNFIYVGTPFQQAFGECENKGVYMMDLNDPSFFRTRFPLKTPLKKKITLHYTQLESYVIQPNIELKIDITGSKTQARELMKRQDMVQKYNGIQRRFVGETDIILNVPQMTHSCNFYQRLMESIQQDIELSETFKENFIDTSGSLCLK